MIELCSYISLDQLEQCDIQLPIGYNPSADAILKALRSNPRGLTRKEISETVIGRNKPTHEIDAALALLEGVELAMVKREETGGHPAQRWYAYGD